MIKIKKVIFISLFVTLLCYFFKAFRETSDKKYTDNAIYTLLKKSRQYVSYAKNEYDDLKQFSYISTATSYMDAAKKLIDLSGSKPSKYNVTAKEISQLNNLMKTCYNQLQVRSENS